MGLVVQLRNDRETLLRASARKYNVAMPSAQPLDYWSPPAPPLRDSRLVSRAIGSAAAITFVIVTFVVMSGLFTED
jgi:hypothetical protein